MVVVLVIMIGFVHLRCSGGHLVFHLPLINRGRSGRLLHPTGVPEPAAGGGGVDHQKYPDEEGDGDGDKHRKASDDVDNCP